MASGNTTYITTPESTDGAITAYINSINGNINQSRSQSNHDIK
jgi:hypothetical protein